MFQRKKSAKELHNDETKEEEDVEIQYKVEISRRKATNYWWIKIST